MSTFVLNGPEVQDMCPSLSISVSLFVYAEVEKVPHLPYLSKSKDTLIENDSSESHLVKYYKPDGTIFLFFLYCTETQGLQHLDIMCVFSETARSKAVAMPWIFS
jgi:hypothetical protein